MKPNQPNKPKNDKIADDTSKLPSKLRDTTYSKEAVNKVVSKLSDLGALDDPDKTWSPRKKSKPKLELDLTLTKADEDFSTQPIPSDMLIESEVQNDKPSEPITPQPEIMISAQLVKADDVKALAKPSHNPPWTLQQFFNGEIDLDVELGRRFPSMPMMSVLKTRTLGTNSGRKVAELSSQDGATSMIIDADTVSKVIQLSFTFGSMLTLKFVMSDLNNMDRDRWVELMRRDSGGLTFLWGTKRWASDYMICISRKHFTNMYAFSPNNFEAGVRLTPAVIKDLLDWLEKIWDEPEPDDEPPQLLTW
jgi:hypothetical protein